VEAAPGAGKGSLGPKAGKRSDRSVPRGGACVRATPRSFLREMCIRGDAGSREGDRGALVRAVAAGRHVPRAAHRLSRRVRRQDHVERVFCEVGTARPDALIRRECGSGADSNADAIGEQNAVFCSPRLSAVNRPRSQIFSQRVGMRSCPVHCSTGREYENI